MITIEGAGSTLARVESGTLSKQGTALTVGQLERFLLSRFPRDDAEDWDRMGLLAGNPAATVEGVAVALDVTADAIRRAQALGANVLVTHHPAFLEPPACLSPSHERSSTPGVNVYEAVSRGVALMNFHTALDASTEAQGLFAGLLGVDFQRILVPSSPDGAKGYGHLCLVRTADKPLDLAHLAARCTSVFGRPPRVWGDFGAPVSTVAIANGSAGDVVDESIAAHADCLVCGEVRYHAAIDAVQAGLCIVELGHDASELPLCALLAKAIADAGVPGERVTVLDQSTNWNTPETVRV